MQIRYAGLKQGLRTRRQTSPQKPRPKKYGTKLTLEQLRTTSRTTSQNLTHPCRRPGCRSNSAPLTRPSYAQRVQVPTSLPRAAPRQAHHREECPSTRLKPMSLPLVPLLQDEDPLRLAPRSRIDQKVSGDLLVSPWARHRVTGRFKVTAQ